MKKLLGNLYAEGETTTNYNDQDEYEQLPAGGYICTITSVRDVTDKEYLYVEFDIAEGEHAGYFKRLCDRANFWGGRVNLSYAGKSMKRGFDLPCKAINASNPGYEFNPHEDGRNNDERTLVGKKIGIVLHEEEYESKDGKVRTTMRAVPWGIYSTDKIASGAFDKRLLDKVPIKKDETPGTEVFLNVPDTETPFN